MSKTIQFTILAFISLLTSLSVLSPPGFVSMLEEWSWDQLYLFRGPKKQSAAVTILLITETSIQPYGFRYPVPRKLLADIVNKVNNKGAKVIGLDILLDRYHLAEHDISLAEALKNAQGKVVLASANLAVQETTGKNLPEILPEFKQGNEEGYVMVANDSRDVAKWMGVVGPAANNTRSFAEEIVRLYTGDYPKLRGVIRDIDQTSWVRINFRGYPSRLETQHPAFRVFEAHALDEIPDIMIKDTIVLIGGGLEEAGDAYKTPFSYDGNGYLPAFGVDICANTIDMMLENDYLVHPPGSILYILSVILLCLAGWFFSRFKVFKALLLFFLLQLVMFGLVMGFFMWFGVMLPMITLISSLTIIFISQQFISHRSIRAYANMMAVRWGIVQTQLHESRKKLTEADTEIQKKENTISSQSIQLSGLEKNIQTANEMIEHKDLSIQSRDEQIKKLKQDLEEHQKQKDKYYIHLKNRDKKKSMDLLVNSIDSIVWIEAKGKDCLMHTQKKDEPVDLFDISLGFIDHVFSRYLMRIHNSYAINKNQVVRVEKTSRYYILHLLGGLSKKVSESYFNKPKVNEFIQGRLNADLFTTT